MAESRQDDDLYELAPDAAVPPRQPSPKRPIPTAAQRPVRPASPQASSPPRPVIGYRSAAARPASDPESIRNLQLPMALLVIGLVVETASAFLHANGIADAAELRLGVDVVTTTGLIYLAVWLASKRRQFHLGPKAELLLKAAALAVAPPAVFDLAMPVFSLIPLGVGALAALATEGVCYFTLIGALFDLDESDTWFCLCTVLLVRLGWVAALMAMGVRR